MIPDYYYKGMEELRNIEKKLSVIEDKANKIMPSIFKDDAIIIDKATKKKRK